MGVQYGHQPPVEGGGCYFLDFWHSTMGSCHGDDDGQLSQEYARTGAPKQMEEKTAYLNRGMTMVGI